VFYAITQGVALGYDKLPLRGESPFSFSVRAESPTQSSPRQRLGIYVLVWFCALKGQVKVGYICEWYSLSRAGLIQSSIGYNRKL